MYFSKVMKLLFTRNKKELGMHERIHHAAWLGLTTTTNMPKLFTKY